MSLTSEQEAALNEKFSHSGTSPKMKDRIVTLCKEDPEKYEKVMSLEDAKLARLKTLVLKDEVFHLLLDRSGAQGIVLLDGLVSAPSGHLQGNASSAVETRRSRASDVATKSGVGSIR